MIQFLLAIPEIVLYGCAILIAIALAMGIALVRGYCCDDSRPYARA
jgi:hypothetical protein